MTAWIWNILETLAIVWLTALVGYSLCLIAAAWCVEQEHRKFRQDADHDGQRGTTPTDD